MTGFEIEFSTDFGTGPRYSVDVETGEVMKDDLFIHGGGPITDSEVHYPGDADAVVDPEVAEEAYNKILDSGMEPGQVHVNRRGDRDFKLSVYGSDSEEVDDIEEELVYDAVEDLKDLF